MIQEVYLQPHSSDPILDEELVLALVREFVPGARKMSGVDETGGEARAYAIDDGVILKVQRPHRLRLSTSLEREAFFLQQLEAAGLPGVSVPRVLGYFRRSNLLEGIVMTRVPGTAVARAGVAAQALDPVLSALGRTLAAIHSLDCRPFHSSGLFPVDQDAQALRARMVSRFERSLLRLSAVPDAELDRARALRDSILAGITRVDSWVAVHSNPGPEHTFIDDAGSFSGLIDFGDSYVGHPINDLRRWGLRQRKIVLAAYLADVRQPDGIRSAWETVYQVDAILDMLARRGRVDDITGPDQLLAWE
jgi:aminoglycoside phosphotransferase (APT) family kinase protein